MGLLVDGVLEPGPDLVADARVLEELGYTGCWVTETAHDPFIALTRAAGASERLDLGTGIAVAFARNPMTVAVAGNDLQQVSGGRLLLGLGSQVRAHIIRRFSMPWSHPAARMREFVLAVRAIWRSWNEDEPLDFRGEFYQHTLSSPLFRPAPNPWGRPPILLAGVGETMTEVAGEVADGFLCAPLSSPGYLRDRTLPALRRGRQRTESDLAEPTVSAMPFVATGATEEELAAATRASRERLAFYASTPAYRPVLTHHGWAELAEELTALSKQQRWSDMADAIDDQVLHTFAVVAEPPQVAGEIHRRYAGLADRVTLYTVQGAVDGALPRRLAGVVEDLTALSRRSAS